MSILSLDELNETLIRMGSGRFLNGFKENVYCHYNFLLLMRNILALLDQFIYMWTEGVEAYHFLTHTFSVKWSGHRLFYKTFDCSGTFARQVIVWHATPHMCNRFRAPKMEQSLSIFAGLKAGRQPSVGVTPARSRNTPLCVVMRFDLSLDTYWIQRVISGPFRRQSTRHPLVFSPPVTWPLQSISTTWNIHHGPPFLFSFSFLFFPPNLWSD